jgi:mRNA-degrading endonuclease RelE of RelBE toxin-antitoxin system
MTIIKVIIVRKRSFSLVFDPEVKQHLQCIEAKHHSLIRRAIEEQLRFEPATEMRNRKPLQRPIALGATWEFRCGPDNRFRVLYEVDAEGRAVQILAIGVKQRNQLFIGGEEVEL